jgi:hypothetical protein
MAWQKVAGRGKIIFGSVTQRPEHFPFKLAVLMTRGFLGKVSHYHARRSPKQWII